MTLELQEIMAIQSAEHIWKTEYGIEVDSPISRAGVPDVYHISHDEQIDLLRRTRGSLNEYP